MRTRDDGSLDDAIAYNRGWEWWLLDEAKKRNPDIVTMALAWGVPGWIGNRTIDAYWSDDNIDYHVRWVRGLWKHHRIQLDW
jgi:galactosylceramidase